MPDKRKTLGDYLLEGGAKGHIFLNQDCKQILYRVIDIRNVEDWGAGIISKTALYDWDLAPRPIRKALDDPEVFEEEIDALKQDRSIEINGVTIRRDS